MKNRILNIALVLTVVFGSLAFNEAVKREVKTSKSKVTWKGYKVTGSHEGTVAIKSGHLVFDNEKLTGGEFVIDMTTIISTDLSGGAKGKLEGHLKSEDFFGVSAHPTSTLVITKAKATGKNAYDVTGNLTIKGKAQKINFDLSVYGSKATATLKVDRTVFGLKYGSGSFFDNLGDKAIYDEFDLVVDLEF